MSCAFDGIQVYVVEKIQEGLSEVLCECLSKQTKEKPRNHRILIKLHPGTAMIRFTISDQVPLLLYCRCTIHSDLKHWNKVFVYCSLLQLLEISIILIIRYAKERKYTTIAWLFAKVLEKLDFF
ncbi:hypothetical protein KP509_34G029200 [Ceratopteris richardii]|uniref:Uncharacterized protein n=1 Tax=Ceratopteris richardii TaxID=49495 RepID=A0A8T2QJA4_CERRI|nr:hypothetical protein KP509_34G029200 [Ceratopteris richardii]